MKIHFSTLSSLRAAIFVASIGALVLSALVGEHALAQPFGGISDEALGLHYGAVTGLPATDIRLTAARIIRVAMGLLGTVALVIILFAGFTWMTAGGNEEKIAEAKKWIFAGVIGLAIILAAYSITNFVVKGLVAATQGG